MAAPYCTLAGPSRPCVASSLSTSSGRSLASTAHLSRRTPLLQTRTQRGGGAASTSRDRATLQVAAFQIPKSKWWEIQAPPNVIHIHSVQQLVDAMGSAGDRLVIVDVFAPWCAACRALYPKVCKIMTERPDVLLLAVNFDDNKTLVKALGVKVLPWFIFYRGKEGKLEEFSASLKRVSILKDAIARHTTDRCVLSSMDGAPVLREFPTMVPSGSVSGSMDDASADQLAKAAAAAVAAAREPEPVA